MRRSGRSPATHPEAGRDGGGIWPRASARLSGGASVPDRRGGAARRRPLPRTGAVVPRGWVAERRAVRPGGRRWASPAGRRRSASPNTRPSRWPAERVPRMAERPGRAARLGGLATSPESAPMGALSDRARRLPWRRASTPHDDQCHSRSVKSKNDVRPKALRGRSRHPRQAGTRVSSFGSVIRAPRRAGRSPPRRSRGGVVGRWRTPPARPIAPRGVDRADPTGSSCSTAHS